MKSILKNFWITLTRFKLSSTLNIIGLSVAFAIFTIIMMQVRWEYTFGKTDRAYDSIYRFDTFDKVSGDYNTTESSALNRELVRVSPDIMASAMVQFSSGFVEVERDGEKTFFQDMSIIYTSDNVTNIFDLKMNRGEVKSMLEPNKAIISASTAKLFFGDSDPVGRTITPQYNDPYTICGVFEDLPTNATINTSIIVYQKDRKSFHATLFVKIDNPDKRERILQNFKKGDKDVGEYGLDIPSQTEARLIPVGDTYFDKLASSSDFIKRGNKSTTDILFAIACLIILIAVINFINFYTALAPVRVKGLNTRLVFGSTRGALRRQIIFEGVGLSVMSFGVALILIDVFNSSNLRSMLKIDSASIGDNAEMIIGCAIVALIVGFFAGLFPSRYCTRFEPALALKGTASTNKRGGGLRMVLVGFQYVISIGLIICAIFVNLQHSAMTNAPLGFNPTNLMTVNMDDDKLAKELCQQLEKQPFVKGTATYNGAFGKYDCDMNTDAVTTEGDTIQFNVYFIDAKFLDVIQIPIIKGTNFAPDTPDFWEDYEKNQAPPVIMNSTAAKIFQAEIGMAPKGKTHGGIVVGITEDFVSKSISLAQGPIMFNVGSYNSNVIIRIDAANTEQNIRKINQIIKTVKPDNSPNVTFYSDHIAQLYQKEKELGELISLFSVVAILLSLIGVFGLVVFETQFRRKEIGIRKVFGSKVSQIIVMFNRRFVWIVAGCFAIAVPITYFAVSRWLEGFAYKTPIYWWVFALGGLIVLVITIVTVTVMAYRTSVENPVKSIKNE